MKLIKMGMCYCSRHWSSFCEKDYEIELIKSERIDTECLNLIVTFTGEKINDLNRLREFDPKLTDVDLAKLGVSCFDDNKLIFPI